MLIMLEGAVLCLVFTALIVPFTLKNPTASIGDYPPAIRKRCAELGVFPARSRRVYLRSRPLPLYPEHMVQGAEQRPAVDSAYGEQADA